MHLLQGFEKRLTHADALQRPKEVSFSLSCRRLELSRSTLVLSAIDFVICIQTSLWRVLIVSLTSLERSVFALHFVSGGKLKITMHLSSEFLIWFCSRSIHASQFFSFAFRKLEPKQSRNRTSNRNDPTDYNEVKKYRPRVVRLLVKV